MRQILLFSFLSFQYIALLSQDMTLDTSNFPPVIGPDPSYRVGTFYYSWYGNPKHNGDWIHWTQNGHMPPSDIASDYFPILGAYSSIDPLVIAQHMAWLRKAGIGIIITTWWGQESYSNSTVPIILEIADHYKIKVTFHIEPYWERSADRLIEDIIYINNQYRSYPAFFLTTKSSKWMPGNDLKGLFYLFAPGLADQAQPVGYSYWTSAMDSVHALSDKTMIMGQALDGFLADVSHFDGIYNYIVIDQGENIDYSWGLELPMQTFFAPAVAPGNSAARIGYEEDTFLPRRNGKTYRDQWNAALSLGIEPFMVNITSFNEWHEGSQIEPAAINRSDGKGYTYSTYSPLDEDGYLILSKEMIGNFINKDWNRSIYRIHITTTSDWTTLGLLHNKRWHPSEIVFQSDSATSFNIVNNNLVLTQTLKTAQNETAIQGIVDMFLLDSCIDDSLYLEISRGNLGSTSIIVSKLNKSTRDTLGGAVYSGLGSNNVNSYQFAIPCGEQLTSAIHEEREETQVILEKVYPNPFNNNVTFNINLPDPSSISLFVLDLSGQRIHTLIDGQIATGQLQVNWDGRDISGNKMVCGIYFIQLISSNQVQVKKIILL